MSSDGQASPATVIADVLATAVGDTVVAVAHQNTINTRWANSSLTTNGLVNSAEIIITAMAPVAGGVACATRAGPVSQAGALLAEVEAAARRSSPVGDALPLLEGRAHTGWTAPASPLTADAIAGTVAGLAAAFGDASTEFFGYAEQSRATTWVGTSTGLRWRSEEDSARFELSAKADARRRSAWAGRSATELSQIDVDNVVAEVRGGLARQRTRLQVQPEPMPVILTPSAVADLMVVLWWHANARDAAEGTSAFAGRDTGETIIGQEVSGHRLTLRSDPHDRDLPTPDRMWTPWTSAAASVFDTGAEIEATDWISDGILTNLQATRACAAEFDVPFRPSADNLILTDADGHGDLGELVSRTEHALLVTSLWYIRDVDPQTMLVTGLTRDGTYLIDQGRIVGSCGNFRFNDSPLGILARVVDASDAVGCLPREQADYFTRTRMPAMLINDFGLSTASEAT